MRSTQWITLIQALLWALVLSGGVSAQGVGGGVNIIEDLTGVGDLDGNGDGGAGEKVVIEAAIEWWEMIITAPVFAVNVEFKTVGFAGAPGSQETVGLLCLASDFAEDAAGRPTNPGDGKQNIDIRNNNVAWYVDATPHLNEEFDATGDPYFFNNGPAGKFDLLTCIKHELGHVLGFFSDTAAIAGGGGCAFYTKYCAQVVPVAGGNAQFTLPAGMGGPIALDGPGAGDPVSHPSEVVYPNDLMSPIMKTGERHLQSAMDRKMLAHAFGYTVDLDTHDCAEDVNNDGTINVLDLIDLLLCFGLPADPGCLAEDVNQDGVVNVLDLIDLLLEFGQACL